MNARVCLVSYRKVLTIWKVFKGKSVWERIQREKMGYIAVSEVGRSSHRSSKGVRPACVTQKTSFPNPSMCSSSFLKYDSGMRSGKQTS